MVFNGFYTPWNQTQPIPIDFRQNIFMEIMFYKKRLFRLPRELFRISNPSRKNKREIWYGGRGSIIQQRWEQDGSTGHQYLMLGSKDFLHDCWDHFWPKT